MSVEKIRADIFCGAGGTSLGIVWATGKPPEIAINHSPAAIHVHSLNHPETRHFTTDVREVCPKKATAGKKVGLAWFSPDCKFFSRARGGKPVDKNIRSLPWIVVKWAQEVAPDVLMVENVREIMDWGPLIQKKVNGKPQLNPDGTKMLVPDPTKKGRTFKQWVGRLRGLGYKVEWKVLNASSFGAATHRYRLFVIARRDGEPISWPQPTHVDPAKLHIGNGLKPWKTAAECIDWTLPCPSIFLTKEEAKAFKVRRPLAEATMRRIAKGLDKYVLNNPKPFLISVNNGAWDDCPSRVFEATNPLTTITGKGKHALIQPYVVKFRGDSPGHPVTDPLPTITSGAGAARPAGAAHALGVVAVGLVPQLGERSGQEPRTHPIDEPAPTVTSHGAGALVAAFLAKHFGGVVGHGVDRPTSTITAKDHHSLIAANLIHLNHGDKQWSGCDAPLRTVVGAGNHAALVYAFLTLYNGQSVGASLASPAPTIVAADRLGLVVVTISGEPYIIVDIGMRMLTPRELARAQGFPDTYRLVGSNHQQVAHIGNSVSPYNAMAVVAANFGGWPMASAV